MNFRDFKKTYHLGNKRLYNIWCGIKKRCNTKSAKDYKHYGARGITVCEEWGNSYKSFYDWATKNGYTDELTIDRIDNNKGYSPDNCRWATYKEQENNRRYNKSITYKGKTQNVKQWAEELGINYKTLWNRLFMYKWDTERAFNKKRKAGGNYGI